MFETFKEDMRKQMENLNSKFTELSEKLNIVDDVTSVQFADNIVREAADRMGRARNVFVRGAEETAGDEAAKSAHDGTSGKY